MYFASGSCTRVLPPSKRQKAQKIAWTRCPSYFSIPPSATSCTHRLTCQFGRCFCTLCRGLHRRPAPFSREAKKVCLFYSARFSHFINGLTPTIKIKSWGLYYFLLFSKSYLTFSLQFFESVVPVSLSSLSNKTT